MVQKCLFSCAIGAVYALVSLGNFAIATHALKTMRFYYCNFLLAKHPAVHLFRLQSLQNAATFAHCSRALLSYYAVLAYCTLTAYEVSD